MHGYPEGVPAGAENGMTSQALLGEVEDISKCREVSGTAIWYGTWSRAWQPIMTNDI